MNSTQVERWRPVLGFEGIYEVSNIGRVRSVKTGKMRKLGTKDGSNHKQVTLSKDGKKKVRYVHRLVLESFAGECPKGKEACHLNGVADDNRIENLYWGTRKENVADMKRHGTNGYSRRTHCPRGHELSGENLRPYMLKKGHRACIACHRAYGYVLHHGLNKDLLQEVSDRYYQEIMTDQPEGTRMRRFVGDWEAIE